MLQEKSNLFETRDCGVRLEMLWIAEELNRSIGGVWTENVWSSLSKLIPLPIVWHLSELHREITGHSKDRWWNQSALGHSLLSRSSHTHTHKSARIGVGMTLHGLVCQTYSAMEIMCFGSRNVWKERKTLQSETMKSVILNIFTTHSDALLHIST